MSTLNDFLPRRVALRVVIWAGRCGFLSARRSTCLQSAVVILCLTHAVSADDFFVDNMNGRDANDGSIAVIRQASAGPVRTLGRALQLANFGDTINIRNTGEPYYESISLTGSRHSGTPNRPFTIIGNGATISGLRSVPPEGWRKESNNLWKLTLTRKGYYQILRGGQALPEYVPESGINPLEQIAPGQWVNWKGSVYFRPDGIVTPEMQNFAYTADQTGISLHHVENVLIINLVVQHFRFDGIHAQGLCNTIELHNVTSVENGRAGIASSGASTVDIYGGTIERNGRFQILTKDRSTAESHEAVQQE